MAETAEPGYSRDHRKSALLARLSRVEGQVRGVRKMVDESRYCVDILTQIDAVTAAMARVQDEILQSHLDHCVPDALESDDPAARRAKVNEVVELLRKFRRG